MKSRAVFFNKNKSAEIREIDIPSPCSDEVQVKTISNGICMFEVWQYNHMNFDNPVMAGHEGIGIVTAAGSSVRGIKEGDYVAAWKWSEYSNIKADNTMKLSCKPEEAGRYIVEPVSCAVNAVSCMNIYPGDRAVVFGAGYMGLLLIQLLCCYPLSELVVVDVKQRNLELALQYGADRAVNLQENGEQQLTEMLRSPFDICFEASGAGNALEWCTKLAKQGGKIGIYSWHHEPRLIDTSEWHVKGLQVMNSSPSIASALKYFNSFIAADRLMAAGKVSQSSLITHRYKIDDIAKAMEESTLRSGHFIKSVLDFA